MFLFITLDVFDFDEELGGVNVTPMAQFPSSSEDDDYDSSSTEGIVKCRSLTDLNILAIFYHYYYSY